MRARNTKRSSGLWGLHANSMAKKCTETATALIAAKTKSDFHSDGLAMPEHAMTDPRSRAIIRSERELRRFAETRPAENISKQIEKPYDAIILFDNDEEDT